MQDSKRTLPGAHGPGGGAEVTPAPAAKSVPIASRGIRTTTDVKRVAFALAEDVLNGAVAPKVSGAAVSAMSVGLRTFQLEMRHAENLTPNGGGIDLLESPKAADPVQERRQKLLKELAELDAASAKAVEHQPA